MEPFDNIDQGSYEPKEEPMLNIVRLKTSYYSDARGIHCKISLVGLKRLSTGYQLLQDDSDAAGAELVFPKIVNLRECKDGIYKAISINDFADWETGIVEDYDYRLIPYEVPK